MRGRMLGREGPGISSNPSMQSGGGPGQCRGGGRAGLQVQNCSLALALQQG